MRMQREETGTTRKNTLYNPRERTGREDEDEGGRDRQEDDGEGSARRARAQDTQRRGAPSSRPSFPLAPPRARARPILRRRRTLDLDRIALAPAPALDANASLVVDAGVGAESAVLAGEPTAHAPLPPAPPAPTDEPGLVTSKGNMCDDEPAVASAPAEEKRDGSSGASLALVGARSELPGAVDERMSE